MSVCDDWPKMPDGSDFDCKQLLSLAREGNSPFQGVFDMNLLIREIEEKLDAEVVDIPIVSKGSNHYDSHCKLSNGPDIVARLSRSNVNTPDFDGFPFEAQVPQVRFKAAVYELLRSEPDIIASRLLHDRIPAQHVGLRLEPAQDIAGCCLFLFQRAEEEANVWRILSSEQRDCLLAQAAHIRGSLFNFPIPLDFAAAWLRERIFEQKPNFLPIAVAPTRDFCVALFTSKIEATIRNVGDMIGLESDNNTVGHVAAAAKESLLRLIPRIMPAENEQASLHRLVLEHRDFGINNMSITADSKGDPLATSVYDSETGRIVPAILPDPLMAVWVDLVTDENAAPSFIGVPDDATSEDRLEYMLWARQHIKVPFHQAPNHEHAIQAGKDARHLWFALRDWRGNDPEKYFSDLGV